jgi:hypothetical protein
VPFASFSIEAGVDNATTMWVEDRTSNYFRGTNIHVKDFIDNDKDPAERG